MLKKMPPLRLIVNSACNGNCCYCHREGNYSNIEMPKDIIRECARIANDLEIPYISITGGEPTLRDDLSEILGIIHAEAPSTKISITTNGFKLSSLCHTVNVPIENLNLSISSFDEAIAAKYQNVDPQKALYNFHNFRAQHKNLNIVITSDNYLEIPAIIKYCVDTSTSLDLMFELKEYTNFDIDIQAYIFNILESLGDASVVLNNTPRLLIRVSNIHISVKHPFLTSLHEFEICKNCDKKSSCFEKICAIRVLPDSSVSPCLNKVNNFGNGSLLEKISGIYKMIEKGNSYLSFIYGRNY